ncbi:hypothetical protein KP509_35G059900 [Ceratopteris richardii]|uniref:GrpE protein homolog n=1 Tax=Ceratopteris richardii TaxID=49495 RepID=A0A8T2QG07_CERRI|nr:hypothetical protein KP509_35G059900 [Ceratopteris richardii]
MAANAVTASTSSSSPSAEVLLSRNLFKQSMQRSHVYLRCTSFRVGNISTSFLHRRFCSSIQRRAVQADVKVITKEEPEAGDSDHWISNEGTDGSVPSEASSSIVDVLLSKYRESALSNDETALEKLDAIFLNLEKEKNSYANQVSSLKQEISSLKDRLLRLNADFDNFRKRSERDRIAVSSNVKGDVVNSLLPMLDNFERAKTQIKIETEGEQRINYSYQGIYKQFVDIMKGLGVTVIESVGKEFDPNMQEAIMREESTVHSEGIIMEEFRRGFMLGDKLLRPAMVKVSAGPPASPVAVPDHDDGTKPALESGNE